MTSQKSSWLGKVQAPSAVQVGPNYSITMPYRDVDYGEVLAPSAAFSRLVNSYSVVQRKEKSSEVPFIHPTSDVYICFCKTPDKEVAYLAGPRSRTRLLEYATDNTNFFVVGLSYLGSYALLPISQDELTDKSFILEDVFPKWGGKLTLKICDAKGINAKAQVFEEFLKSYADKLAPFPKSFTYILKQLCQQGSFQNYSKITKEIGYSKRHLRRLFVKYTGLSPNKYLRMLRCETAMKTLIANPNVNHASVAYELDFCDQSHFIREFREFYNLTPKQFVKEFLD